jgi:glycosyltransferase involved in cell wall biosynthesis
MVTVTGLSGVWDVGNGMAPLSRAPPRVSVVMPNHNGGLWLAEAVGSLLGQTFADFELLIVDDGSTDDSPELLAGFARDDPRVRVIAQPRQGLAAALNRGLEEAAAPLLARLDSDDIARPLRLERQVAFMDAHPEVGLVGSWALQIDVNGRPRGRRAPQTEPAALARDLERTNPFVHSSVMARTAPLRCLGGYRAALEAAEDYDLWLRLAETTEVANLPEYLVSYRMHDAGVSRRQSLRQAFSVRLARAAAEARRAGRCDPAADLKAPPDWHAPVSVGSFYDKDAALFRWLDVPTAPPADCAAPPSRETLLGLSHAERRLAALALFARSRSRDRGEARVARGMFLRLCLGRPRTVVNAVWSLRT